MTPSNPIIPSEGVAPPAQRWRAIDHVQLAIPPGGEEAARRFFVDRLGFEEIPKPPVLAARGGAWFAAGAVQIHVGIDPAFVPAAKAHPALRVSGLPALVVTAGLDAVWSEEIRGTVRCHVHDPFGNRIELIEAGNTSVAPERR